MDGSTQIDIATGRKRLTLLSLLFTCVACGSGNSSESSGLLADVPNDQTQQGDVPVTTTLNEQVVLAANLREWSDQQISIEYSLLNNSDEDLVVLDASRQVQIELLTDGVIRLFRGKQATPGVLFESPPTIEGRTLSAGESVQGSGSRAVPLSLDYNFDSIVNPDVASIEFCLGYGSVDVLGPTVDNAGLYSLNDELSLQSFACTELQKPLPEIDNGTSSLSDDSWQVTLRNVLSIVDDPAIYEAVDAANSLLVSGDREQSEVDCSGGRFGVEQLITGESHLSVTLESCTLDGLTMNGVVEHNNGVDDIGRDVKTIIFRDFSVDNGTRRVHVSKGVYRRQEQHPETELSWSELDYEVTEAGQTLTISNLNSDNSLFYGTALDRRFATSFNLSASWTMNRPIVVTTPVSLFGVDGTSALSPFARGQLQLDEGLNQQLLFDADSGQEDVAMITLNRDGTVASHFVSWVDIFGE